MTGWCRDARGNPWGVVALLGVVHMAVDATSILAVSRRAGELTSREDALWLLAVYHLLAFATQPILGHAVDRLGVPRGATILGSAMVAAAAVLSLVHPLAGVWAKLGLDPYLELWLAGLGNALVHVGAGSLCLTLARGRAAMGGVFVGPGDLGVVVGASVVCALLVAGVSFTASSGFRPSPLRAKPRAVGAIALLLLGAIALRSVVGGALLEGRFGTRSVWIGILASAALAKIVSGLAADRIGWARVSVIAALAAAPAMALLAPGALVAMAAMFLVQAAMPVTLAALARLFEGRPAFAFGMATFAVWFGSLPSIAATFGRSPVALVLAQLACAGAIFGALRLLGDRTPGASSQRW
jgi:hypothetical protein